MCRVSISPSLLLQLFFFSFEQNVLPSGTCGNVHLDRLLVCSDRTEFVVTFLLSSVRVGNVAQRIRVGSRIGRLQSDRDALLFSVMSRIV